MTISTKPFEFTTEFSAAGEVLSGEKAEYKRVEEIEQDLVRARAEGEAAAMATIEARIAASLETILATLTPVEQVMAQTAAGLRNEAIELAMAAARRIAGKALDEFGEHIAIDAIADAARQLRDTPEILVIASPETAQGAALRLENNPSVNAKIRFHADPSARPGDWRIEFASGAVSHNRETVEKAIEDALEQRKNDPVESQMDLFGGAQVA